MRFSDLEMIFTLLRAYCPGLETNAKLGDAVARKEGRAKPYGEPTVRGWMRGTASSEAGQVPDGVYEAIVDLLSEELPDKRPRSEVEALLKAHPILLHNALCPISSRAWSKLLAERMKPESLTIQIAPPHPPPPRRPTLGFGHQVGYRPPSPAIYRTGPRWLYRFGVKPPGRSNQGEAFVLSERDGERRLARFTDSIITTPVAGGTWWIPTGLGAPTDFFQNDGSLGCFRHFVVAVDGRFDASVREALSVAMPMSGVDLDTLGERLLQCPANAMTVCGTSIEVDPEFGAHSASTS